MTLFGTRLPAMSSLLIWAALWELVGQLNLTFFVPPLSKVIVTLVGLLPTPAFLNALGVTAYAFFAGVAFAVVIGIPVGILMGKNRLLDEALLPWVNIFLSAPLTALVPVLMVLFGFGAKTIIITTTLFAVWIIILNARAGVLQINRSLVEMAHSFGASSSDAFFCVASRMKPSSFMTSSSARMDFSRPTKSGTIMCGNTTMSRNGNTG